MQTFSGTGLGHGAGRAARALGRSSQRDRPRPALGKRFVCDCGLEICFRVGHPVDDDRRLLARQTPAKRAPTKGRIGVTCASAVAVTR